jgi:S-adenosylmethionine:tRNA ribosyltransferase-isomerase
VRSDLFDYHLPRERIAQTPIEPRDASRLLVVGADGSIRHRVFRDLPDLLAPGDLLIVNDSRVLPARLIGRRPTGGRAELLLLRAIRDDLWEAMASPGRRLAPGATLLFPTEGDPVLEAEVVERTADGGRIVRFRSRDDRTVLDLIHTVGRTPLPPYITAELDDPERYQTVYARLEGSSAAPTAGLHVTPEVIRRLAERGVRMATVTLHVGLATFRPIRSDEIEDHEMHQEWYEVPAETGEAVAGCRGSIVAVGTTTVRCLEAAAEPGANRRVQPGAGSTDLYITPGYRFRVVDRLVTNFHLPRSSLLVLVSAFAGLGPIRRAYECALQESYRFLSFGDAMLIDRASGPTAAGGDG